MARITGADGHDVLFLVSPAMEQCRHHPDAPVCRPARGARARGPLRAPLSLERLNAAGETLLGGAPVIAERLCARRRRARSVTSRSARSHSAVPCSRAPARAGHRRVRNRDRACVRLLGGVLRNGQRSRGRPRASARRRRRPHAGNGGPDRLGEHPQEGLLRGPACSSATSIPTTTPPRSKTGGSEPAPRRGERRTARGGRTAERGGQPQRLEDLPGGDRCGTGGDAKSRRVRMLCGT